MIRPVTMVLDRPSCSGHRGNIVLQITTGKLFTRPVARENPLRGVLFTNLSIHSTIAARFEGASFGRLLQTSELSRNPKTLVYEFTERIEANESGPEFLLSLGADPYLQDMATLLSFVLNCTCSPNIDLVRRLTSGERGIATGESPGKFISRVFARGIYVESHEVANAVKFIEQMLGVRRKTYLSMMRAIRTYVTGIHRVADDLELAYTLMVAAGESLAQDFDGHTSSWDSIAEQKRVAIDNALAGAGEELADCVRDAIVASEHTLLARRFQGFVIDNVASEYFLGPFEKDTNPLARSDLAEVLSNAYQARSQYVHQLKALPDAVTMGHGHHETTIVDRAKMLTLQGISRLMRHVIITFVHRQPVVEAEPYRYLLEMAGVAQARLDPSFWVAFSEGDISVAGRDKLEGFLAQLAGVLMGAAGAAITDISEVLEKFSNGPAMKAAERRPYLALLVMFNAIAGEKSVSRNATVEAHLEKDFGSPCPEAMVSLAFFGESIEWPIEGHFKALGDYKRRRKSKSGLRFPRMFEAACALELAERYRSAGLLSRCKELIAEAADDYPEHEGLRTFFESFEDTKLDWRRILLPESHLESEGAVVNDDA